MSGRWWEEDKGGEERSQKGGGGKRVGEVSREEDEEGMAPNGWSSIEVNSGLVLLNDRRTDRK